MIIEYIGVKEINGSLIALDGVKDATFEETDFHPPGQRAPNGRAYRPDGGGTGG